jgi:hypothetical protein
MRAEIMSGPAAFFWFSFLISVSNPLMVISMSGIVGDGLSSGFGMLDLSSLVKMDWYWLFRILALLIDSAYNLP